MTETSKKLNRALSVISSYYATSADATESRNYLCFSPGSYQYLFRPRRRVLRFLSERFEGAKFTRRVTAGGFRALSVVPQLCRFLPRVSGLSLPVAAQSPFDLAIIGYRIKLFSFDSETVATLPLTEDSLEIEVTCRRSLPNVINVPQILDYDPSVPAYIEELIAGKELSNPIEEWPLVKNGIIQLRALYRRDSIEKVSIADFRADLEADLDTVGLAGDTAVSQGLTLLNSLALPDALGEGTIHGDFHVGNLLQVDDAVYVLDWENIGQDSLIADFMKLFTSYYFDTGRAAPVEEMVTGEGRGAELAAQYATVMGDIAVGGDIFPSGVPVLFLLDRLRRKPSIADARGSHQHALLSELVETL